MRADSMEIRAQEDCGCSGEARGGRFPTGIHDSQTRLFHNEQSEVPAPTSGDLPPQEGEASAQMADLAQEGFPQEMSAGAPLIMQAVLPPQSQQISLASLGREAVSPGSIAVNYQQALVLPPSRQILAASPRREAMLPGSIAVKYQQPRKAYSVSAMHQAQAYSVSVTPARYYSVSVTPGTTAQLPQEQIAMTPGTTKQLPKEGPGFVMDGACATKLTSLSEAPSAASFRIRPLSPGRVQSRECLSPDRVPGPRNDRLM